MRLAHPFSRALIALGFTLALGLLFLAPHLGDAPVLARPLQQTQPVDLTVDSPTKYGDPNALITFNFTVTTSPTNTCASQTYNVSVTGIGSGFTLDPPPGTITVGAASTTTFQVQIRVGSTTQPGTAEDAVVQVACQGATSISDAVSILVVATVNGATPTATLLPTATATPTGMVGPSPTAGPICADAFEPDNGPSQAKEIRPDQPQTHVICPRGDEDFLYFGGVSGKVFTIDVSAMTEGLDLSLSLYDAAGNLLAFNDDFPRNNDPFDIKPRIQSYRVPVNGQYFIKVRDNAGRGDRNLSYVVELQSEAYGPTPTQVAELCTDLFEPDGVPAEARLLVIREVQPNHRFCPAGDADWVRFFAKAGQRFVLRVNSQGRAGADPVMILVDRDGASILDFEDDTQNSLDPQIEFEVPVDGFYFAQLKNVGDIGNQFIAYDLAFEPLGLAAPPAQPTSTVPTTDGATATPTVTGTATTSTPTVTGTSPTATIEPLLDENGDPYPAPSQTAFVRQTLTALPQTSSLGGVKGAPAFVNGQAQGFVDPAMQHVWSRTDQVVASRQVDRSWMWGPGGLVARAETYTQSNGGARQVQYFDKARMEINDWKRDRSNPWFVTNGLLVKELIDGQLQIGDVEFLKRAPADIAIAGDANDASGPTYASFAQHTGRVPSRVGQVATATLRRDGSTGSAAANNAAKLVVHVPETGHNIPQVFWDFLNTRGPIGDGKQSGQLVDWVFAMGYPISEPFWTKVKVGGVERDVLVQAFQRRVLTYTPGNPEGWKVEMGNVGRHYYTWRYGKQP
ncbi:MAG: hypothetical protein M3R24_11190 [Chloroflexota bacterium]|nr:hypothetical protein [Chloroflexota bacterium]